MLRKGDELMKLEPITCGDGFLVNSILRGDDSSTRRMVVKPLKDFHQDKSLANALHVAGDFISFTSTHLSGKLQHRVGERVDAVLLKKGGGTQWLFKNKSIADELPTADK